MKSCDKLRCGRTLVNAVSLCGAIGAALASGAATAQSTASAHAAQLEEITVTARRRAESLQDVPIAVTVMDGKELESKGITNAIDLARAVPSVVIRPINIDPKQFKIGIRGVVSTSSLLTDDSPIGTYFADAPIGHPYGFGDNLYDLQSVQVLKGPQGTLFGRNTTGGAFLVDPVRPSIADGFGGKVKLAAGDYDLRTYEAAVNVPIKDVAAFRLSAIKRERDGYTKNVLTGQRLDEVDNYAVRAQLLVEPTDNISINTMYEYLNADEAPNSSVIDIVYPGVTFGGVGTFDRLLAEQEARGPREVASWMGTNGPNDLFSPTRCVPGSTAVCRESALPKRTLNSKAILNEASIEFDGVTLKNIYSYRTLEFRNDGQDLDPGGSPASGTIGLQSRQFADLNQATEELQLTGDTLGDRLTWATGAFYMKEWGAELGGLAYFGSPVWSNTTGTFSNKSKGAYLQGSYEITPSITGTLGFRRNWDDREADDMSTGNNGTLCLIRVGDTAAFLPISDCHLRGDKSWTANTWTASVEYAPTAGTMVYATARRGYKSGGFSLRSHRESVFSYDPEFVTDVEVGLKADWDLFGMPIRTNVAVFRSEYTDQQVQVSTFTTVPITTYVDNAGKTRIVGGEVELTARPTDHLEISAFVSYSDPEYLEYVDAGSGADLSYRPFAIPKYSGGLSAQYEQPLPQDLGVLALRADAAFQSENISDNSKPVNIPGDPTSGFGQAVQPGYGVLNLRADWVGIAQSPVDASIFVTNALDKVYRQGSAVIVGIQTSNYAPPRMWGVDVTYRFGGSAN